MSASGRSLAEGLLSASSCCDGRRLPPVSCVELAGPCQQETSVQLDHHSITQMHDTARRCDGLRCAWPPHPRPPEVASPAHIYVRGHLPGACGAHSWSPPP
eukprot:COSAG01_NODE_1163_length_11454_cov_3.546808_12_plen_101_part_00